VYRLTWRLPLAGLVAFSHLQFSQIRGRQAYSIVRNIPYLIPQLQLGGPFSFLISMVAAHTAPPSGAACTAITSAVGREHGG
jgi:hypothetical protein